MDESGPIKYFALGDYIVFSTMLGISLIIGMYFAKKEKKTSKDFLLGGKSMSVLPVSMSMIASSISAISLLGKWIYQHYLRIIYEIFN